jgi:hypothetical protein
MQIEQALKSWSETSARSLLSVIEAQANQPSADLSSDLLEGATAIAKFVFGDESQKSRRRVYHMADMKRGDRLPVFRIGQQIFARKSTLVRWIAAREAA